LHRGPQCPFTNTFTLWLDADGRPVSKALAEMTAGEVRAALEWHLAEAARLSRASANWSEIAETLATGGTPPDLSEAAIATGAAALRASAAASAKAPRLQQLVLAAMPQWRSEKLGFVEALERYWPR
jgi:hypothetical protein